MATPEVAIELEKPYTWVSRSGSTFTGGNLNISDLSADPASVMKALRAILPRARRLAVLLPAQRCYLQRISIPENINERQTAELVKLQVARGMRQTDPVVDWTRTPTGIVAAGCSRDLAASIEEGAGKAGFRLDVIEPAPLAMLRAVSFSSPKTVLVVRVSDGQVSMVVGSGEEFHLARHLIWYDTVPDTLVLEIRETVLTHERESGSKVEEVMVISRTDELLKLLPEHLGIPVNRAAIHPGWGIENPDPSLLTTAGALLEPHVQRTGRRKLQFSLSIPRFGRGAR